MLSEQVLICENGLLEYRKAAGEIQLPNIIMLGLFLSRQEQKVLRRVENSAKYLLEQIKKREDHKRQEDYFEIDVPCVIKLANQFPKEERQFLLESWAVYVALIKHFLPDACCIKGRKESVRYKGTGWFS